MIVSNINTYKIKLNSFVFVHLFYGQTALYSLPFLLNSLVWVKHITFGKQEAFELNQIKL